MLFCAATSVPVSIVLTGLSGWVQVFGEPKGQPSRALPNGAMDSTMGQLAGVGMGAAAVLLFAHLLKGASL